MLSIEEQVRTGRLVCPRTRGPLRVEAGLLVTLDGQHSYPVKDGVPFLLKDCTQTAQYLAAGSGAMATEYGKGATVLRRTYDRLARFVGDKRTPASQEAFQAIFSDLPTEPLCISVGGGPQRVHEYLVNINIGPFPNVDVVGDAYALPYADGVVDAIHCEAVLEHLEEPEVAVREMVRVLRPGRLVFAATPFLQCFHGYPDHFQNYTLSGHRRLFERCGLSVVASGTAVGGTFALRDLSVNYLRNAVPGGFFGRGMGMLFAALTLPALYLDLIGNRRGASSSVVASTTFVLAAKAKG